MANLINQVQRLFDRIYDANVDVMKLIEDNVSPDYIQEVDGHTLNYKQFVEHILAQRKILTDVKFSFVHLMEKDMTVASLHQVKATKIQSDNKTIEAKVYAFFAFDNNNKLIRCDEMTRITKGEKSDEDIGRRH